MGVVNMNTKFKILIGSVIRQTPHILKNFLDSLNELEKEHYAVDYYFIDNNEEYMSTKILKEFAVKNNTSKPLESYRKGKVIIEESRRHDYHINDKNIYYWKQDLTCGEINDKNRIVEYCKKKFYDYLLLIESNLMLHPKTLKHLISTRKHIISEIVYDKGCAEPSKSSREWIYNQFLRMQQDKTDDSIHHLDMNVYFSAFLQALKQPGIYKMNDINACTLISKEVIQKGINFHRIYNVPTWTEGSHFSIRTAVLGFQIFIDTTYPACEIYTESEKGVKKENVEGNNKMILESEKVGIEAAIDNIVKNFIQKYLSCDYRIVTGFEGFKYLAPHYIDTLTEKQDFIINYLIENKIRCTAVPLEVNIDIAKAAENLIEANVNFIINIIKEQKEQKKEFRANLILKRYYPSMWLVDSMAFKDNNDNEVSGFSLVELLEKQ
ncbi:MAG: hypothetical protein PWP27_511 [Clostridiales bacterium]|jgi:hypothetical protein|nr:hypothetical protein [Clostridiales bacterium]MDK2932701.1 hypothetical protein [Clostridiales bacterium]